MRLIFLIFLVSLLSCKKDKLEGDTAILIGKWKWIYTYADGAGVPDYFEYPSALGKNFSIEFLEKGCIYFYEDGKVEKKRRVIIDRIQCQPNQILLISLESSKRKENGLAAFLYDRDTDTLEIQHTFPFESTNNVPSYTMYNYFIRE